MNPKAPRLSLLVLSEDSGADAHATVLALVKKMLLLLDPACATQKVAFEPANEEARKVMAGNGWRSEKAKDQHKNVLLARVIASKLLEEDVPGFVLFHVDGDVEWARREQGINCRKLDEFVEGHVMAALDNALRKQWAALEIAMTDETIAAAAKTKLERFLRIVPYYSIEAWLYQNTTEAMRICKTHCGKHLDQMKNWAEHPGQLDEIPKPKSKEFSCLGNVHNRALAERGFPYELLFNIEASFHACVLGLLACSALCEAVQSTHRIREE